MTVAELITELQKLPPNAEVTIEGYVKGTSDHVENWNHKLVPEMVETAVGDDLKLKAVIWASNETAAQWTYWPMTSGVHVLFKRRAA